MTVREMFGLMLILLVGLLVNRCAHLSGGQQLHYARYGISRSPSNSVQIRIGQHGAKRQKERSREQPGDAWRLIEPEEVTPQLKREGGGKSSLRSTVHVLVLSEATQEVEIEAPPPHLVLSWAGRQRQVRVETARSKHGEGVVVTLTSPARAVIAFRTTSDSARLALPEDISELTLEEPYGITLRPTKEGYDAVTRRKGGISLRRDDGNLILSTQEWELIVEDVTGEVRMLSTRGRLLQRLAPSEDADAADDRASRAKGGGR